MRKNASDDQEEEEFDQVAVHGVVELDAYRNQLGFVGATMRQPATTKRGFSLSSRIGIGLLDVEVPRRPVISNVI